MGEANSPSVAHVGYINFSTLGELNLEF